jgi:hypothetical protein
MTPEKQRIDTFVLNQIEIRTRPLYILKENTKQLVSYVRENPSVRNITLLRNCIFDLEYELNRVDYFLESIGYPKGDTITSANRALRSAKVLLQRLLK